VLDAVQERNDDRATDAIGRCKLERRLELCRLCRHPEQVDVSVEHRRDRHVHFELA
jgi:hypothetical protein